MAIRIMPKMEVLSQQASMRGMACSPEDKDEDTGSLTKLTLL